MLTFNVPIEASLANSVDPDQTAPIGAVFSGSTLFASILNSSVLLGNYMQQTTSADDIIRCIFWRFKGSVLKNAPEHICNEYTKMSMHN